MFEFYASNARSGQWRRWNLSRDTRQWRRRTPQSLAELRHLDNLHVYYTTADWRNLRTTELRQMPTFLSRKSNLEGLIWKQQWNVLWSCWYISRNKLNLPFCLVRSQKMSFIRKRCFLLMRWRLFHNRRRFILAYYCQIFRVCVSSRCVRCVKRCVRYVAGVRVKTVLYTRCRRLLEAHLFDWCYWHVVTVCFLGTLSNFLTYLKLTHTSE